VLLGIQLASLHQVGDIDRQLSLVDLVADEVPGVRVDNGQVEVLERHRDIGVQVRREQVHLPGDVGRGVALDLAIQANLGARLRVGRQPGDRAIEGLDADAEARLDP
jgi:hypothetical protein